jgi:DNA repair protein RecN (Recombination protein N)
MADYHYLVEKNVQENRTYTTVSELSESLREHELARMLGGSGSENDSGLMHARNMLKASSELKNGLVYKKK